MSLLGNDVAKRLRLGKSWFGSYENDSTNSSLNSFTPSDLGRNRFREKRDRNHPQVETTWVGPRNSTGPTNYRGCNVPERPGRSKRSKVICSDCLIRTKHPAYMNMS